MTDGVSWNVSPRLIGAVRERMGWDSYVGRCFGCGRHMFLGRLLLGVPGVVFRSHGVCRGCRADGLGAPVMHDACVICGAVFGEIDLFTPDGVRECEDGLCAFCSGSAG